MIGFVLFLLILIPTVLDQLNFELFVQTAIDAVFVFTIFVPCAADSVSDIILLFLSPFSTPS